MTAIYRGRWTRGDILTQACNRAGTQKPVHLARSQLNRVLEDLYVQWEWPFLYTEAAVVFPATNTGGPTRFATFALPSDFLKVESDAEGLRIVTVDGITQHRPMLQKDRVFFQAHCIPDDQEADAPRLWYVDYATGFAAIWPRPLSAVSALLTYKRLPPDIAIGAGGKLGASSDPTTAAYDLDIPLFPWGRYLALKMESWVRQHEHDPQWQVAEGEAQAVFDTLRTTALPRNSQPDTVPLDEGTFGPGFRDEFDGWPTLRH